MKKFQLLTFIFLILTLGSVIAKPRGKTRLVQLSKCQNLKLSANLTTNIIENQFIEKKFIEKKSPPKKETMDFDDPDKNLVKLVR